MGLFDRLFGGRFTQPPPDELALSEAAIMRELHPFRAELKAFTQALLVHSPDKERIRLIRRVMRCYDQGDEPASALVEALTDADKGQSLDQLVLMAVDWRGFDSFQYLAPYLVKASGIEEVYVYKHTGTLTMEQVLDQFDEWLTQFGRRYLHVDTGSDQYVGFIVKTSHLDSMLAMAAKAGIDARLGSF